MPYSFEYKGDIETYWQVRHRSGVKIAELDLNEWQLFRLKWIMARLNRGNIVYDFGAGLGAFSWNLEKKTDCTVVPFENSDYCLQILEKNFRSWQRLDLSNFKATDFPLPRPRNILLLEVLEHLPNPERVLLEALSLCEESVFLSIPNSGYLPYRLRLLAGRFPRQWISSPSEHLRFWTNKDFKDWLECLEIRKFEVRGYMGIPILNRLMPSVFAGGIICEIRKWTP